jgi:hypothetical protein
VRKQQRPVRAFVVSVVFGRFAKLERVKGIEPSYEAWEAAVLPLNYTREAGIVVFSCGLSFAVYFLPALAPACRSNLFVCQEIRHSENTGSPGFGQRWPMFALHQVVQRAKRQK